MSIFCGLKNTKNIQVTQIFGVLGPDRFIQTVPTRSHCYFRSSLIRVYTVGHCICIVLHMLFSNTLLPCKTKLFHIRTITIFLFFFGVLNSRTFIPEISVTAIRSKVKPRGL